MRSTGLVALFLGLFVFGGSWIGFDRSFDAVTGATQKAGDSGSCVGGVCKPSDSSSESGSSGGDGGSVSSSDSGSSSDDEDAYARRKKRKEEEAKEKEAKEKEALEKAGSGDEGEDGEEKEPVEDSEDGTDADGNPSQQAKAGKGKPAAKPVPVDEAPAVAEPSAPSAPMAMFECPKCSFVTGGEGMCPKCKINLVPFGTKPPEPVKPSAAKK